MNFDHFHVLFMKIMNTTRNVKYIKYENNE